MIAGPVQTILGLILDTNRLTVAIPSSYVNEVHKIINATWHTNRRTFVVSEAQQLTGKLGHLAEGAPWVHHLLTHLYASIACALIRGCHMVDMGHKSRFFNLNFCFLVFFC
jgi:hypothetical protein